MSILSNKFNERPFFFNKSGFWDTKKSIFATMGLIQKRHLIYIPFIVAVLVVIGIYFFQEGNPGGPMPPQPGMFQGPPPPPMEMGRPPMDNQFPPQMPGDGHRPMRPETLKLVIALLIIGILWGITYYIRNLKTEKQNKPPKMEDKRTDNELIFKTDYKQVRIKSDEIMYIEGMSEYLKIYYTGSPTPLIVHLSMKRLLEQLPDDSFMRIHKSYIVNLKRITGSSRTQVTTENGTTLPIGESYRKLFLGRVSI